MSRKVTVTKVLVEIAYFIMLILMYPMLSSTLFCFLIVSAFASSVSMWISWKAFFGVTLAPMCALVYYFTLLALTPSSALFWLFVLICAFCVWKMILKAFLPDNKIASLVVKCFLGVLIALSCVYVICVVYSAECFHAEAARDVANVIEAEASIAEDFEDLSKSEDFNSLALIDRDTAIMLGDKQVAQLKHASWYEAQKDYHLIKYQGKYYYLGTIDYGDYFKWKKAKDYGIPGYILVPATLEAGKEVQEAKIVKLDQPIHYSPGTFGEYDLERHLRMQFPGYIFHDDHIMEIDEEGGAYFITGVLHPTEGPFGVKVIESFILTNAETGDSEEYSVDNAPDWIDHVYPFEYLMKIAHWHYAYVHGWKNANWSKTDVWYTSYVYRDKRGATDEETAAGKFCNFFGYSSIIQNGQVMTYTGLTAANNSESNLGWLTIDDSTGRMIQYRFKDAKSGEDISGAEESFAQNAVEQQIPSGRYEATFPLPANIAGEPSYIMCLKGKAGLIQRYGICNIQNHSIVVEAETLDAALRIYLDKLGKEAAHDTADSTSSEPSPEIDVSEEGIQEVTGKIVEVYTAEVDGTTQFYYVIGEDLYRSSITLNEMQVTWKVGDELTIYYYVDGAIRVVTDIQKE